MKALDIGPFVKAVESEIAEHPCERLPFTFAALSMDAWAARLKCSKKTVERKFAEPPFHSEKRAHVDGVPMSIVRVRALGERLLFSYPTIANWMHGPWLARAIDLDAIAMAAANGKAWNTGGTIQDGKAVMTKRQHWFLVRLASAWPNGHQIAILKCVLADWPGFVVRANSAMELAQDRITGDTNLPVKGKKFLDFPTLSLMARFPVAAIEQYQDFLMECVAEEATQAREKRFGPRAGWNG
jgi:hypothetical protein